MKSQAYRMALLYDFYGDVLTPLSLIHISEPTRH